VLIINIFYNYSIITFSYNLLKKHIQK